MHCASIGRVVEDETIDALGEYDVARGGQI
jgi:hypothetical protein